MRDIRSVWLLFLNCACLCCVHLASERSKSSSPDSAITVFPDRIFIREKKSGEYFLVMAKAFV